MKRHQANLYRKGSSSEPSALPVPPVSQEIVKTGGGLSPLLQPVVFSEMAFFSFFLSLLFFFFFSKP